MGTEKETGADLEDNESENVKMDVWSYKDGSWVKVVPIIEKVRESSLQWFEHVKRRMEEYIGNRMLNLEMKDKRKIERSKTR